ncbi:MAG TPA: EAL domain-containing protein, partial [Candidatus Dormibacteraeota bacterium]|nr:EAL domain-containing protein [Candidatus Dormibacteraeota bacterium]
AALDVVRGGASSIPEDVLLSLNVSPRTLESGELNATVFLAILRRHGVAPNRVILELTEREAVREPEHLRDTLRGIQLAGVRVAADDVGAGNAGLRLLSQIHFDIVKLDLSLVQEGARRETSLAVIRSLADLAARWGAMVVAEGVETPAQLHLLRSIGVPLAQGYLLGRPSAIPDARTLDLDEIESPRDRLARVGLIPVAAGR